MKAKRNKFLHLLIAAAAAANLILLFLFQYGLSNATPAVQAATREAEERAAYDAETGFGTRQNDTEASAIIVTNGTETANTTETDDTVMAAAEGTEPAAEGETSGSADLSAVTTADNHQDTGSEQAASGTPSITLSEELPAVTLGDLSNIANVLHDLGALSADDGYGNDISGQVTAQYEEVSADSMDYHVTFSVTTGSGQTATAERTITVQNDTVPVLELVSDTVTLELYSSFDYMTYVKTARDIDGSSLTEVISVSGNVDINTPGSYEVIYSTVSQINYERVEKTLTVVVG